MNKLPLLARREIVASVEDVDSEKCEAIFCVSPPTPDRHGTIFMPECWDLSAYMANPIVLWGHRKAGNPEDAIGCAKRVWIDKKRGLMAHVRYAVQESELAAKLWPMVSSGIIRGVSQSCMVLDAVYYDEPTRIKEMPPYVRKAFADGTIWAAIVSAELSEISQVLVGSNRQALSELVTRGALSEFASRGGLDLGVTLDSLAPTKVGPSNQVKTERRATMALKSLLINHRTSRGLTVEQLAEITPVSADTIRQIERGVVLRAPDEVVEALAAALGADSDAWIQECRTASSDTAWVWHLSRYAEPPAIPVRDVKAEIHEAVRSVMSEFSPPAPAPATPTTIDKAPDESERKAPTVVEEQLGEEARELSDDQLEEMAERIVDAALADLG